MSKLPVLLLPAGLLTLGLMSAPPVPPLRTGDRPLLPRPGLLRTLFRGQIGLVSDYYWILTINRVGVARTATEYRDIYSYADLTTDLDPKFAKVYTFAGINIPVHMGREQYANTTESTQLLRKGVKNVPEDQRTQFQLAYNLMFFHRQYKEAADIISELARRPDALPWYSGLATRLYAQSGDFDTSMSLAVLMRDSAEDEETREYYDRRVREIVQEQMLRHLDAAVAQYRERQGKEPATVEALVEAGVLPELPEDPLGGRFYLANDGRVYSSASKFRLEVIYDERAADGSRVVPQPRKTETDSNATAQP